ncbi:hypothetical protein NL676_038749 [Syzygium grande]|nr:hypothetical protein NL676_038749 [Syzygium grande]
MTSRGHEDAKRIVEPVKGKGASAIGAAGFCWGGDEIDHIELLEQFEEILTTKSEVDAGVKIFPKVSYGWIVKYDVADEEAVT